VNSCAVAIRCALCGFKHKVQVPFTFANSFVISHQSSSASVSLSTPPASTPASTSVSPTASPAYGSTRPVVSANAVPDLAVDQTAAALGLAPGVALITMVDSTAAVHTPAQELEFECPRCELIGFFSPNQLATIVASQCRYDSATTPSSSSSSSSVFISSSATSACSSAARAAVQPASISLSISPYEAAAAYQLKSALTPPAYPSPSLIPPSQLLTSPSSSDRAYIDVIGLPNVITQLIIDYLIWYRSSADFHEGDWVDARDFRGKWYRAQVQQINHQAQKILVKWQGFSDRWNTWISVHSSSLAPSNTMVNAQPAITHLPDHTKPHHEPAQPHQQLTQV
jgi:phage FluMu protein Com